MSFQWLPLTWDAVAVFATGFAAVSGATIIGLLQMRITRLQTEIQREQAESDKHLRLNDLKLKLLGERAECIQEIKRIHGSFHGNMVLPDEERTRLFAAIQKAELIFEADVVEGLNDVAWKSTRVASKFNLANARYRRSEKEKAEEANDEAFRLIDEIYEAIPNLISSMIHHARISDVNR